LIVFVTHAKESKVKYNNIVEQIEKIKNSHLTTEDDRSRESDGQMDEMKKVEEVEEKMSNKSNSMLASIRDNWLRIAAQDPFLPKTFLPTPWYGEKAKKLVRGLMI